MSAMTARLRRSRSSRKSSRASKSRRLKMTFFIPSFTLVKIDSARILKFGQEIPAEVVVGSEGVSGQERVDSAEEVALPD